MQGETRAFEAAKLLSAGRYVGRSVLGAATKETV